MRERGFDDLRRRCGAGRSTTSTASGRRSGIASASASAATPCSPRREMPGAQWFPGTRLNYAEHAFRGKDDDALAIVAGGEQRELTPSGRGASCARRRARSRPACARWASERGDRVVAYMPNIPETIAAFLATASLGAVWSSCSPDFGARSVIDRFAQIEPKVLLAVDGYRYGGRDFDRRDTVRARSPRDADVGRVVRARLPRRQASWEDALPRTRGRRARRSSASRSTTRCGSSTPPARPGCRRRSSRARAGSCSST